MINETENQLSPTLPRQKAVILGTSKRRESNIFKTGITLFIPCLKYNRWMKENELIAIKEHFQQNQTLRKSDLIDFIVASFSNKEPRYARFYLADILRSGIAYPIETNVWQRADGKKVFSADAEVDPLLRKTLAGIQPSSLLCLWDTSSLNHFLSLQSFQSLPIVSSFSPSQEDVFTLLSAASYFPLSLKAYLSLKVKPVSSRLVLVSTMNEDAPLFREGKKYRPTLEQSLVVSPRIEKILVDCYCGDVPLDPAQIRELFVNAFSTYFINFNVLERYARSRGKKEEIRSLLNELSLKENNGD
jgi:hypothetical protein